MGDDTYENNTAADQQPPVDNSFVEPGAERFGEPQAAPETVKDYHEGIAESLRKHRELSDNIITRIDTMNLNDIDEKQAISLRQAIDNANGILTSVYDAVQPKKS